MNKISMYKKYITRSGLPVRLLCTDMDNYPYPVVATVRRNKVENVYTYTDDGRLHVWQEGDLDLVEVKPTVKYLKPLHQILNENPDYYIDNDWCIRGVGEHVIVRSMLNCFGKRWEHRNIRYYYCESWIEEREE